MCLSLEHTYNSICLFSLSARLPGHFYLSSPQFAYASTHNHDWANSYSPVRSELQIPHFLQKFLTQTVVDEGGPPATDCVSPCTFAIQSTSTVIIFVSLARPWGSWLARIVFSSLNILFFYLHSLVQDPAWYLLTGWMNGNIILSGFTTSHWSMINFAIYVCKAEFTPYLKTSK